MYKLPAYSWMMEDKVRIGAYMAALKKAVRPGAVVVDVGAGVGTWALICCQLGARKVYAIEVSPVLQVAKRLIETNGFSEKVELIQDLSTAIELPERADVIITSLHGQQPVFRDSIVSIIDARKRFLKTGGVLIPGRESMWATVVEAEAAYEKHLGFWQKPFQGLDMRAGKTFVVDWMYKEQFTAEQVLADKFCYATLDYYRLEETDVRNEFELTATRRGTGHGVNLWFDSELVPDVGFSNAPGCPETIFGGSFLPWPEPVPLEAGDKILLSIGYRRFLDDYHWHVSSRITNGTKTKAEYSQSSIWDTLPKLNTLTAKR